MESGKKILCEILSRERILLVLDDVDELEQLNALCGSREWFGLDSTIIITTRDKGLLDKLRVDHVYRMREMDESESVTLFSWHAFKLRSPREDFEELSRDAVAYCGGLPLALSELGREMFGKDIKEWKRLLGGYRRIPHPIIHNALKSCFDGLGDETVKNVFLEIACFYVGLDQNEVIQKLNDFGDLAARSVSVLVERSLVIVDDMSRLGMHVLIRDMGREIFRQRSETERIYDVFFSVSEDTPSSFTSRLLGSLEKLGISILRDDKLFTGEDQISPSQVQAIQRCRLSVVVFSRGYAPSRRFLEVLEQITECRRIAGQFLLPIFFKISKHDLQNHDQLDKDLTKMAAVKDKVESWKIALARISHCREGFTLLRGENDEYDIERTVERATFILDRTDLFVAEFPVEVRSRVLEACGLLNIEQKGKGVVFLGIWGMVGIGKTTIAKAIFNEISGNFESASFLPNIREVWEQDRNHVSLQERLLSEIYKLPKIKIDNISIGKKILQKKLSHRKVLILLDDVNKLEQLNTLCGSREWFGPGSVIIITTRDRSLLRALNVDHVYRIQEMDESESRRLFNHSPNIIEEMHGSEAYSDRFGRMEESRSLRLDASVGLPLALEVEALASSIPVNAKEFPHSVVQKAINKCIDNDLNDTQKSVFFDIACFLNGMDYEEAKEALKAFKMLPNNGISSLEDRCLVTIDEHTRLRMHVVLQEVGRKMIDEQMKVEHGSWIFDVFLSFRGEDTRAIFTSHLYAALANAGIDVFKDDDGISRGDRISISLLQAIRRSRVSVVVLSEHYANSRWCLQELVYIMECRRVIRQVVIPVFYHVEPSSVRNQTSTFGEAFEDLLKKFSVEKDKEKSWRKALCDIGRIAGIEIIKSRDESKDITKIVQTVTSNLDMTELFVAEHPVGVDSRVEEVIQLLKKHEEKDVLFVGIWGMGGVGKTTIAKAIYNQIGKNFEGKSFLQNVREDWQKPDGPVSLQNKLLSNIVKSTAIKIDGIDRGKKNTKGQTSSKNYSSCT